MKLSRRILDVLRASLASPPRLSDLGKARSPARLDRQLEHIRKSLLGAAAREKRLQDELARAEESGQERDAIRLRRELADLARSRDELQAALDLIEARLEMERESQGAAGPAPATESPPSVAAGTPSEKEGRLAAEATETPPSPALDQAPPAQEEEQPDLSARKARLAAPQKKPRPTK